jgi:branched-chain amino acid transport system substrate-binding protein
MNVGGTRRKVEFVIFDDQSKPDQAVRIYEKLITDDKVDLLLAPWGTPFHLAIAPVLEKFKFPVVGNTAASVALRTVKPGYIWFPTSAIPDRIGAELTAMLKAQNVKSVAVLSNVLPFTKEIKNFLEPELKKAGITVKVTAEYPPDISDMTSTLTQVKQANVDAVLALAYPGDSVLYAKQAKELGLNNPFHFVAIGPTDAFFAKAVGATSAEGVVSIAHWSPRAEWKGSQAFYDAYVKKFGEDPDYLNSALAWMSLEILETTVEKTGLDKEKMRAMISSTTFDTINGKVKFDGVQNAITPTAFVQTQKGKLQIVWPASLASGKYEAKKGW